MTRVEERGSGFRRDDRGGHRQRGYERRYDERRYDDRRAGPELTDDIDPRELGGAARAELNSLARPVADTVARHLVATGRLLDEDPEAALAHAMAARRLASRIAAVREAVGLAAYRNGDWSTAIAELRTYHRMSGSQAHVAILADCERAQGRPERAVDIFRSTDLSQLDRAAAVELLIVAAGARADLGQADAAVTTLQVRELAAEGTEPWLARLRYAYADALLAVGRRGEAREWFARAVDADEEAQTDATERLLDLDGVQLDEAEDVEDWDGGADWDGAENLDAGEDVAGAKDAEETKDLQDVGDVMHIEDGKEVDDG